MLTVDDAVSSIAALIRVYAPAYALKHVPHPMAGFVGLEILAQPYRIINMCVISLCVPLYLLQKADWISSLIQSLSWRAFSAMIT